jgi:hypothetical protein
MGSLQLGKKEKEKPNYQRSKTIHDNSNKAAFAPRG